MFRNKTRKLIGHSCPLSIPKLGNRLNLEEDISKPATCNLQPFSTKVSFTFLNLTQSFEGNINWNTRTYGKLWVYNLNYFDYLHQTDISKEEGLKLIRGFIHQVKENNEGLEPYPISLRGINWIKFLSKHDIEDKEIDSSLYSQYQILLDNLEYHLLGNHLLENGCSLLFGAYYLQDQELYNKAKEILSEELEEQILNDGGHFERSTMYHCILLERLMDCHNVMSHNDAFEDTDLEQKVKEKVKLMLGWLAKVSVDRRQTTGDKTAPNEPQLPLLNDAAKGIGSEPVELFDYADRLGLEAGKVELGQSGYRRYSSGNIDIICDVGRVGPDYQPGHAHSDTFSFVLYVDGKPVIIDPGISTYENNDQRQLERSTNFHNTVQYGDKEQSEVWSAFRVGRRAQVEIKAEDQKKLTASHNGYQPWGITHEREWTVKEDHIYIRDRLIGKEGATGKFYLHFHPLFLGEILVQDNSIQTKGIKVEVEGAVDIRKYNYDCPDGYNQYIKAPKIKVTFFNHLITKIFWNTETTGLKK
ncbi:alginate lyase family protein [Fodinibius sp. Rm-B-1B1-1]|uniref:alginate lyase family protein n=1 Tax=Fodinibius alkaliphilus TaxID=3140241 RepID=UPI003159A850